MSSKQEKSENLNVGYLVLYAIGLCGEQTFSVSPLSMHLVDGIYSWIMLLAWNFS